MRFRPSESAIKMDFPLAPMIDIIFQMLIFFMVATSIQQDEAELSTNLPSNPTTQAETKIFDQVVIEIQEDGRIVVNNKEYDSPHTKELPELQSLLKGLAGLSREQVVIVDAPKNSRYERLVDVLNACAGAKIKNVFFASTGR